MNCGGSADGKKVGGYKEENSGRGRNNCNLTTHCF
jgi:hypothetical protein